MSKSDLPKFERAQLECDQLISTSQGLLDELTEQRKAALLAQDEPTLNRIEQDIAIVTVAINRQRERKQLLAQEALKVAAAEEQAQAARIVERLQN